MDNNHYNVPYGVKEIGDDCFYYCESLKEIIIPNTVTKIGKSCFNKCSNLTKIKLSDNISNINSETFNNCSQLKEITLPKYLETIDKFIFNEWTNLTTIHFGTLENMKEVWKLNHLKTIKEITIGNEWKYEGDRLFRNKDGVLSSFILPTTIQKINGQNVVSKQLRRYTIPTNVTKINNYCFVNCKELTEIKGIERIKEFGNNCFINCDKLNF